MDLDQLLKDNQKTLSAYLEAFKSATTDYKDGFTTAITAVVFSEAEGEVGALSGQFFGDPRPVYNNLQVKLWTQRISNPDFAKGEQEANKLLKEIKTDKPAEVVYYALVKSNS